MTITSDAPGTTVVYAGPTYLDPTLSATGVSGTLVIFNIPVTSPTMPYVTVTASVGNRTVAKAPFFVRENTNAAIYLPPTQL